MHEILSNATPAETLSQAELDGISSGLDEDDQRKAGELMLSGELSIRGQAPQQRSTIVFFLDRPVVLPLFRWALSALNSNPSN